MNRLLALKTHQLPMIQRLSTRNQTVSVSDKSCVLCKILQDFTLVTNRLQSTKVNPTVAHKTKVRKKRTRHFNTTELLEVSDKTTSQRTTKIQKANATQLNQLLGNNGPSLSHTSLKQFPTEHTYCNLTVVTDESWKKVKTVDFFDSERQVWTVIPNDINVRKIIDSTESLSSPEEKPEEVEPDSEDQGKIFHPEIPEDEMKTQTEQKKTLNLKDKKGIIEKTMAAFFEVCSIYKLNTRSMIILHRQIKRFKVAGDLIIDDIDVYNALLRGLTARPQKIVEVLKIMDNCNVKPNAKTFGIVLESIGTSKIPKKYMDKLRKFFIKSEVNFDEVMRNASFAEGAREKALEAIRIFEPNYIPNYGQPVVQYDNELVNHLNDVKQLKFPKLLESHRESLLNVEQLKERTSKQLEMEKTFSITVDNIEVNKEVSDEVRHYRQSLNDLHEFWRVSADAAFRRDLRSLSAKRSDFNHDIFLKCLPVEDYVSIVLDEAKKLAAGSETYSPTVGVLYMSLGRKVYDRYKVLRKQDTGVLDKVMSIQNRYCKHYAQLDGPNLFNSRQIWQWIEHELKPTGATLDMDHRCWVPPVLTNIGKFLYHIIMRDLSVDVNCLTPSSRHTKYLPAFYTIFRTQKRMIKEEVKPHPTLSRLYKASCPSTLTFPVNEVPMLCPPAPWIAPEQGGYLIVPSDLIRLPAYAQVQKQRTAECGNRKLFPTFDALNQLASVPWIVNEPLLDVILEVFNAGGSTKLDVPQPPSSLPPPEPPTDRDSMDRLQRYHFFKQKLQYQRHKSEMHSLRCDCLYKLSLANHFRKEIFWLPHNMDFRGRVYPIPPHLNHLGSDLARSLLVFAKSKPLGPNGLDWLKIHLINLTGKMKRDKNSRRLEFANENLDLILDSADRPLTGKKWWMDSEEPWQTLSCCKEIAAAVRSGCPETFQSHFPVHQDGSCNGLQHYAALGKDKAGGASVNLCPREVPQDVYSSVVALVEKRRREDALNGMELAKLLEGFVVRKVIKQTIMTTVYGVTKYGARLQIAKKLKDMENFPKDKVFAASFYLTSKTFESLKSMFTSTKEIQDWFAECARLISSTVGQNVEWVTPLGLPVVQPYSKTVARTTLDCESFLTDKYDSPNVMKQKNAFPPNFIHSLDSCHMMLTSMHCERAGITFVSVHDCYWTHACTVPTMNKICREQFVALHSYPILEDLSMFMSKTYSYKQEDFKNDSSLSDFTKMKLNRALAKLPHTGDLDINEVLESTYFFS